MKVDGKTNICGLIGNPVEHTLSPVIHNGLAEILGQNLVYVPFEVGEGKLEEAVRGAHALNILGLNVTVPYKSQVLKYLAGTDSLAKQIGAVNTLVRREDGYKGFNTDMAGLYRAMCSEGIRIEGESILLLGAGGAARAVAMLCARYGAAEIVILNRTLERAEKIAEEVGSLTEKSRVIPMRISEYGSLPDKKYLALQATSVGLYPDVENAVIDEPEFYKRVHTGYDLIYSPAETRFMQLVRQQGGKACNGLKMLLYQGIIAYELWNDISVDEAAADKIYGILEREVRKNG